MGKRCSYTIPSVKGYYYFEPLFFQFSGKYILSLHRWQSKGSAHKLNNSMLTIIDITIANDKSVHQQISRTMFHNIRDFGHIKPAHEIH